MNLSISTPEEGTTARTAVDQQVVRLADASATQRRQVRLLEVAEQDDHHRRRPQMGS